jgi:hypothetical protein
VKNIVEFFQPPIELPTNAKLNPPTELADRVQI